MFRSILLALSLLVSLAVAQTEPTYHEVRKVVDADTLIVNIGGTLERVRLASVDSPEVYPKSRVEPYGPEASAYAKELLTGRYVALEVAAQPRDRFGRLIATVYMQDGRDVALLLLQAGLAEVTPEFLESKHVLLYSAALQGAQSAKKGLWSERNIPFVDKNCSDFATHAEAQAFFLGASPRDPHKLDKNNDGTVCEGRAKR